MQRKTHGLLFSLPFLLLFTFVVGCSDEPTSIGLGLLPTQDLVRLDTTAVASTNAFSIRKFINTGSSPNLLVGRTLGYEAKALLKFSYLPDTLKAVNVISANLILRGSYRFGESQNLLSFTVHKVLQGWTQQGVTWDSVTASFYEPTVRGIFSQAVADTDSVVVPIDTSLVRNWFQVAGSETISGLLLVPTPESNTILGFHSFETGDGPRLEVKYSKGESQSTINFAYGEDAHVANIDKLVTDPKLLYVQAGVAYHSVLTFDFPGIPAHAGIHQASLELTLDRSTSRLNSNSVDSLLAFYRVTEDSVNTGSLALGRRLDPNKDVYSFNITSYVQRWISGRTNLGLQVEPVSVQSTLDLFTLYSGIAEPAARPRLKLVYSQPM